MANDNTKSVKECKIDNSRSLVYVDENTDISLRCGLIGYPAFLQRLTIKKFGSKFSVIKDSSGLYLITIQENIRRLLSRSSFEFQLISVVSNHFDLFLFPLRLYVPKKTIWIAVTMNVSAVGLTIDCCFTRLIKKRNLCE